MAGKVAAEVEAYLARVPEPYRAALEKLRAQIRKVIPAADEVISYQIPTFKLGRGVVAYAAFKGHCSLFPMSQRLIEAQGEKLKGFKTSKGTIQFAPEKPIPAAVVKAIVKARVAENAAADAKRKAKR